MIIKTKTNSDDDHLAHNSTHEMTVTESNGHNK